MVTQNYLSKFYPLGKHELQELIFSIRISGCKVFDFM